MKLSTPNEPKPKQSKSILLIGPPGGGKTTLAMQFPSLYILDCDLNLDGPERYLREVRKLPLAYGYDTIAQDDGIPVAVHLCFDRLMARLDEAKTNPAITTVCIDSLTHVNEYVIQKILKQQGGTEMEARNWIPFKTYFLNLLVGKVRGLGKHVICIVHESIIWSQDPKNIIAKVATGYEPSVQGSIVDYFGAFFTDMWRCEVRPAPLGKLSYVLTTNRTTRSDLKNSCGMPQEIIDPTFESINKYLKI